MKHSESTKLYEYSNIMEHDKWLREIPYIRFPNDWEVQISPPFSGAVVRFRVRNGNADISVYLDCYDILGFMQAPYWEIYPYKGDTFRCMMNETDKLIRAIGKAIKDENEPDSPLPVS
jgi:hypothetical protein